MNSETKVFLGIILTTIVIIFGGVLFASRTTTPVIVDQAKLAPTTAWATGSATPKATLVEFSDFQCPACKSFEPEVESIISKYSSTLRFVYRHFPLPQHKFSEKSALAAEAAGTQGKFWEYHHLLFPNQESFSDELFPKLANDLNLNAEKFKADMASQSLLDKIRSDVAFGNTIGVNATPTFFLNGKKLDLQSYSDLETAVADAVK